ncbi:MAG TPA: DUF3291 domain-containing protein [Terracidiphilus sp.]|jgi:hypothetical protein|nr:DUF3291 domain-containing protein [Terracidiphilus sp.]
MLFVSLTRLRIRSLRFVPPFLLYAFRSTSQVKKAQGFQTGSVLNDRDWTFWTMTAWDTQASMRLFMNSGAHKQAMPRLLAWCDEASVAHWEQEENVLPSWPEAAQRMRTEGRASKVRYPSARHAALDFPEPRASSAVPVRRG